VPLVAECVVYMLYVLIDGGSTLVHYRLAMNAFWTDNTVRTEGGEYVITLSTLYIQLVNCRNPVETDPL